MIDWNVGVSLFSALVSTISVVVAYLAIRESRRTALGITISNNRQAWINQLRSELVEILSIINNFPVFFYYGRISKDEACTEVKKLSNKIQTIRLLINPNERDHEKLFRCIYNASSHLSDYINNCEENFNGKDVNDKLKEIRESIIIEERNIVELSQSILKKEWIRVKKGE